ncbi:hypothetical protein [Streptomyces sp. NPDC058291]|jgi:hypothetical protein|uniref:hypothetical protein n=1 Tax=Streptomyces sp. NPDC058291 TaxID=3346427 RepID=UPI0036E730E3
MNIMTRYAPAAALLVRCCLPLAACGTEHPGVYGDHGHAEVLGPAKTTAEKDW